MGGRRRAARRVRLPETMPGLVYRGSISIHTGEFERSGFGRCFYHNIDNDWHDSADQQVKPPHPAGSVWSAASMTSARGA